MKVAKRKAAEARVQELEAKKCQRRNSRNARSAKVCQKLQALVARLQNRVATLEGRPPPKGWNCLGAALLHRVMLLFHAMQCFQAAIRLAADQEYTRWGKDTFQGRFVWQSHFWGSKRADRGGIAFRVFLSSFCLDGKHSLLLGYGQRRRGFDRQSNPIALLARFLQLHSGLLKQRNFEIVRVLQVLGAQSWLPSVSPACFLLWSRWEAFAVSVPGRFRK